MGLWRQFARAHKAKRKGVQDIESLEESMQVFQVGEGNSGGPMCKEAESVLVTRVEWRLDTLRLILDE